MPNIIEAIQKYSATQLDYVLVHESKTAILEDGRNYLDLNFQNAGYVRIMDLLTDGLSDYYKANGGLNGADHAHYSQSRRDGYAQGNAKATWEIFKLQWLRGKQFNIDWVDNEETAENVMRNLATEFFRVHVVREIDLCRFSYIASKASASLGNKVTQTIAANAILGEFYKAFEWLTEHGVSMEDQILFVSPEIMTKIRSSSEISRYLVAGQYKRTDDVTFSIELFEGRPIIVVPSDRFFTDAEVADNGVYASANSKLINFIAASAKCIIPVVKLEHVQVFGPDLVQDFHGWKLNYQLYHGCFVPKHKVPGVYVSVSAASASTKTNILSVDLEKVASGVKLNAFYTTPAGLLGDVIYSTAAQTIGQTGAGTKVAEGEIFSTSETSLHFSLVDGNGTVIAVSGEVTLPA